MNRDAILASLRSKSAAARQLSQELDALAAAIGDAQSTDGASGRSQAGAAPRNSESFVGFRLQSRYPGDCAVCGTRYRPGDLLLYNKQLKKSACLGCGEERG